MGRRFPKEKGAQQAHFLAHALWPNGWMDQDATWYGGTPRSRRRVVLDGDPLRFSRKGYSSPPLLSPCLLWPNGRIDQDATWYGVAPLHRPRCVTWGPYRPKRSTSAPQFSARVYCCQTAGWIKIPRGTGVGLGQGNIVRN